MGREAEEVNEFKYLGYFVFADRSMGAKLKYRLRAWERIMGELTGLWKNRYDYWCPNGNTLK